MNADKPTLFLGKAAEPEIVELDEAAEQRPGWIDLDRQAAFGEIDLDLVRAFRKTSADLLFMLAERLAGSNCEGTPLAKGSGVTSENLFAQPCRDKTSVPRNLTIPELFA
jgi:hypothetical protein